LYVFVIDINLVGYTSGTFCVVL